jgi:DNA-binding NtrC family response regulator
MTDSTTTVQATFTPQGNERLYLLVLGADQVESQPLPESGEVIIGRSERCDVRIQDDSISRQHALLRIGNTLTLEDLGSSNGTAVRSERLEPNAPVELTRGEVFTVGTVTLVIQQRSAPILSRRMWSHDYFEGRVREECARAERSGAAFGLLRVRLASATDAASIHEPFAAVLREIDVVGQYGPREYEVLLIDAAAEESRVVAERLGAQLGRAGLEAEIGRACFPNDGRSADKLIGRARPASDKREGEVAVKPHQVVVRGDKMQNLYRLAERVAKGTINILILGETGVGKQVLAENIHKMSPRDGKPFLELNCSAFSETLLESELFGHEKGAFTGATSSKPGLLETANGGTVFLDEIGDMALSLQAKLLRVIENRKVMRVGGLKPKPIDVRFVSATNRELETDVMRGTFRQDLYFRINGVTLSIPPLRERIDEIPGLAQAFVTEAAEPLGQKPPELSTEAFELLAGYSWPGNIRELRNVMERAVLLCLDDVIRAEHLPVEKMRATFATPVRESAPAIRPGKPPAGERETDEAKRQRILEALMACGGNNTEAAKILGVSRRTLGKWLEAYNIPRPRKKKGKPKAASE